MAALPNQTFISPGKPLYLPYTMVPTFSTVTVTEGYAIDGKEGQTWDILATGLSTLNQLATVQYPNSIQTDWQSLSTSNVVQEYITNMNGTTNNVVHDYYFDGQLKGSLEFVSSIYNGNGGVIIRSENGAEFAIRDEGATLFGMENSALNFYEADGSNFYIQHYPVDAAPGQPTTFIHFASATSSISIVNQHGQSMAVGDYGVTLNPGSNSPVFLESGYIDMDFRPMSNVSTINGYTPYKYACALEPDQATIPVNTNGAPGLLFDFPSTITGCSYRVTMTGNVGLAPGPGTAGDKIWVYLSGGGEGLLSMAMWPVSIIPSNPDGLDVTISGIINDDNGSGFGVLINSMSSAGGQGSSSATWTFSQCYVENMGFRQPFPSTIF